MVEVKLSPLELDPLGALRRDPPRPPEHRQPGYEEHELAVDMATTLLCGGTVKYANELPAPIVLKDGLAPYYVIVDRIDARK